MAKYTTRYDFDDLEYVSIVKSLKADGHCKSITVDGKMRWLVEKPGEEPYILRPRSAISL